MLNIPEDASEAQIRERHRALSLIFHPDKQRNELLRESASAQFLEIQAAYESMCSGSFHTFCTEADKILDVLLSIG